MTNLQELDLRNCSILALEPDFFDNLPNLKKIFLAHNRLSHIVSGTFSNLEYLQHLDLSYNIFQTAAAYGPYQDPFLVIHSGLLLDEDVFSNMHNLIFLDFSYTKLNYSSIRALAYLGSVFEQLSLCYTEIPLITPRLFYKTNLKVLDLSGNPNLISNLSPTWFDGLENKLEIMVFRNSNLKNFTSLGHLRKLRMLDLGELNILREVQHLFDNYFIQETTTSIKLV